MQTQSVENIFARSWDLLTKNWVIIVPGLIVGLLSGIASAFFSPGTATYTTDSTSAALAHVASTLVSAIILGVIGVVAYIVTQCYTAGMAGAAWQNGTTTLNDGTTAVSRDGGSVLTAAIGLLVVGVVAAVLIPFTIGLSILAFYIFFLYTIPAAVVGHQRGFASLSESLAIAKARFVPTLIIALVLLAIKFIAGLIALAFVFAPFIGPIVAAMISQVVVVYATLVVVGEYLSLRGAPVAPTVP